MLTLGSLAPFAQAGQTWDGGNATGNWGDANNWNPDGVANFNAGIIFAGNTQVLTNNNAATAVTSGITFDATAGAFAFNGSAVTNSGNIVNQSINTQTIGLNIALGNSQVWQNTAAGGMTMNGSVDLGANTLTTTAGLGVTTIAGPISGNGGINHTSGALRLSGVIENTYAGLTSVADGSLFLAKIGGVNAVGGNLTIGDSVGVPASARVRLEASNQIADTANVIINSDGALSRQGFNETINNLTITSSAVDDAGTLTVVDITMNGGFFANGNTVLNGNIIATGDILNPARIGDNLSLGAGNHNITANPGFAASPNPDFSITGQISGAGGITKLGAGTMQVTGANNYTGQTLISNGLFVIAAGTLTPLGAANLALNDTLIDGTGTLFLLNGATTGLENITTATNTGFNNQGAITTEAGGTGTVGGLVTMTQNTTFQTNGNGAVLNLNGGVNKTDLVLTLTHTGGGTGTINVNAAITGNALGFNDDLVVNGVTVNLNVANTYLGPTFITSIVAGDGILNANVVDALPTLNGRTTISMDATGAGGSILNINASQAIASLASPAATSQVNLGLLNTLTIGNGTGLNVNGTANAVYAGSINGLGGNVVKDDTSTQVFSGVNTYTGTTTVTGGTLVVNGTHNNAGSYNIGGNGGAVEVLAGATVNNGGLNGIALAPLSSVNLLAGGSLSVGDPTAPLAASVFSISNPALGGVAITMANGSTLDVDIFTGAGLGNNTGILASSDRLNLTGTLASGLNGGVLVIGNPLGLTGFRGGDSWLLVNLGTANGPGTITGSIGINGNGFNGLNDAALNLTPTQVGNFNQANGVYTVIDTITGLQMANILGQSVLSAAGSMLSDVNGRLFFLRAGYGERGYDGSLSASLESGEGDKAPSPVAPRMVASDSYEWQAFINANYSNVQIDAVGAQQAGFDADTWTAGVGFERRLTSNVTIGFAANWLESYQDFTDNVGQLEMDGIALSAYGSYVRQSFWADALYSFGNFDIETERNSGGFPVANGKTDAQTHAVQFNTGWSFRFQNNTLVTGPFLGVDYMHASVDGFSESTGGLGALRFNDRNYDSLISRVGWSLTKKVETDFAKITAQVRLSYERQNIKYDNQTSVTLINQPFSPNSAQQNLGQDYLVAGAGLNFQFTPRFGVLLNYQGQFFRESVQAHYVGLRAGFTF